MYPEEFEYYDPETIEDAIETLETHSDREVTPIAGGHSLLPTMKSGLASPDVVVDLAFIDDLHGISRDDGVTTIGSMTEYARVADDEQLWGENRLVAESTAAIGDIQVRNVGTVGGNLAHSDPAADLPAAALAADVTVHAHGPDGPRTIPIDDFFVAMFTTALEDGELLTSVDVPHLGDDDIGVYLKKASPSSGYAIVGVAAVLETDGETITNARVAANGAFGHAMRLSPVEEHLADTPLSRREVAAEAAALATDGVDAYQLMEDEQASADFRAHLLEVYVERAIEDAIDRVTD
ncbi:FAD binding domain-containing protein [Natrialba swarupiae]|uniref:Xanthine dehydrogenase family protein subunit M n=1 Tax=Natrialba swarupiae TaxID=2448032 RepID=A0A5D5AF54_9EURY|nr:FAD binding domain-containing protein [Natrialba swarupiae]TYT60396.1 xanthine dehydrogenase family protein subunit M [Natrialba swarupiae]